MKALTSQRIPHSFVPLALAWQRKLSLKARRAFRDGKQTVINHFPFSIYASDEPKAETSLPLCLALRA
jgi:hypothetical protein